MRTEDVKKLLVLSVPYVIMGYLADKVSWVYRHVPGDMVAKKIGNTFLCFTQGFKNPFPSFHPLDLLVGILAALIFRGVVYYRSKNAKKYRQGVEYGSARWGTAADIKPYMDPKPENNMILTQTEGLTMNNRPKNPGTARNKNVLVIGGSGSGKTRFFVKPNIMQCCFPNPDYPTSVVCTDPKKGINVR